MRYHANNAEQKCAQFSTNLPDVVDAIFNRAKRVATTQPRCHATDYKREAMQLTCETCKKVKKPASFRYTSRPLGSAVARRIFSKFCKPCRVAALLRDPKKLARAIAREEINAVEGHLLRAKIEARHAAIRAATSVRMRKHMSEVHEQHRLMFLEHGISHAVFNEMRLKNPEQAEGLLANVKARHASIKARAKKGDRWALNLLAKLGVRATPTTGENGHN